jgi:hypothetical protein
MKIQHRCRACGATIEWDGPVGRRDVCSKCEQDLHTCQNCRFFDERAPLQCKEPAAEYVGIKDQSNFCTYLELAGVPGDDGAEGAAARARLEALFAGGKGKGRGGKGKKGAAAQAAGAEEPTDNSDAAEAKRKLEALFKKK